MRHHENPRLLLLLSVCSALWWSACDDPEKKETSPVRWQAQAPAGEGAAVYFSAGQLDPPRLVATISARGMEHITGFALRLRIDPLKWRFVEFRPASAWTFSPRAASAARDDLILLGIGIPAATGGAAFTDSPVGTLVLEVLDASPADVSFVTGKSAVLDNTGTPVPDVSYFGAGLVSVP
jgi:hypothetical protein